MNIHKFTIQDNTVRGRYSRKQYACFYINRSSVYTTVELMAGKVIGFLEPDVPALTWHIRPLGKGDKEEEEHERYATRTRFGHFRFQSGLDESRNVDLAR